MFPLETLRPRLRAATSVVLACLFVVGSASIAVAQSLCQQELHPPPESASATGANGFGSVVQAGPGWIAVGHNRAEVGGAYRRVIDVFARPGGRPDWIHVQRLVPSASALGPDLGLRSADGATLVAAIHDASDATGVEIFRWTGSQFVSDGVVPMPAPGGAFADVSGDRLAIGLPDEGPAGEVWILERDSAGVWQHTDVILPAPTADAFGTIVRIEHDVLVVRERNFWRLHLYEHSGIFSDWVVAGDLSGGLSQEDFALEGGRFLAGQYFGTQIGYRLEQTVRDANGVWGVDPTLELALPRDFDALSTTARRLAVHTQSVNAPSPRTAGVFDIEATGAPVLQRWFDDPGRYPNSNSYGGWVAMEGSTVAVSASRDGADFDGVVWVFDLDCEPVGDAGCYQTESNSTGRTSALVLRGSASVAQGELYCQASRLPSLSTCLFLAGRSASAGKIVPGGSGALCIDSPISRFAGAGQIQQSDALGVAEFALPLGSFPDGLLVRPVQAGETWYFQGWYRDGGSFGFTDSVSVLFTP